MSSLTVNDTGDLDQNEDGRTLNVQGEELSVKFIITVTLARLGLT
jgi:hypothetical protein